MNRNSNFLGVAKTKEAVEANVDFRRRRLKFILWGVAVTLGMLQAWAWRHAMNPDGISYLDLADAYLQLDYRNAINAQWSPLYALLLGLSLKVLRPPAYWEFAVAHLVNFAVYLAALVCFDFFWRALIAHHRRPPQGSSSRAGHTFPEWTWQVLGYALFLWSSLDLITLRVVAPDMCVAAFLYLASGLLLRIRLGATSWLTFGILGVVLGLGYLAKAPMFPLAFVFLGLVAFATESPRKTAPRVFLALVVFLAIGSPLVVALSRAKGRVTFGDTGRLTYAWFVNGVPLGHWQGEGPGNGKPAHPTRKISEEPPIYEFGTPVGGTYPPWFDPSYWNEGIKPHFDLKSQLGTSLENVSLYFDLLFLPQAGLIAGVLVLFFMSNRGWSCLRDILQNWFLLIPGAIGLGMYLMVHVESRYIGAFPLLLWAGILSGIHLPDSQQSRFLLSRVTIAMTITMAAVIAHTTLRDVKKEFFRTPHVQCQVAEGLRQMGVRPGEKVAAIGYSFGAYWARLARVSVVAEIPAQAGDLFWASGQERQLQAIETFAKAGARVIVADKVPHLVSPKGWERIGNTNYYAYVLRR